MGALPAVLRRLEGAPVTPRAGIIADDLTGALDSGLEAWKRGFPVRVLFPPFDAASFGPGLVVLDTESRNLEAGGAALSVGRAVALLSETGRELRYKKIDSTLRGNLGGEIEAVLNAGSCAAALLAPSLARAGRTVREGIHRVGGVPLAETEASRDPRWPLRSSSVSEIVSGQTSLPLALLALSSVRRGTAPPGAELSRLMGAGARIIIADAETEGDLARLAASARAVFPALLPCGSAGLFAEVSALWPPVGAVSSRVLPRVSEGGVLVVSGSMSEVSMAQIEEALKLPRAVLVQPAAERLFGEAEESRAEELQVAKAVLSALEHGATVILGAAGASAGEPGSRERVGPGELARRGRLTMRALARASLGAAERVRGMALVGGDTAVAVCRALGATGIEITGEIEPLVPRGVIVGGAYQGLPMVTKAGALGSRRALRDAVGMLAASPT